MLDPIHYSRGNPQPAAEQLTPERLIPRWPSPVTYIGDYGSNVFPAANR